MTIRAIAGLVLFNVALLGIGLAILWGIGAVRWLTDAVRLAGVAYLVALGSVEVVLTLELVLGIPVDGATAAVTLLGLATSGLFAGLLRKQPWPRPRPGAGFPQITVFVALVVAGIVLYFAGLFRAARLATTLPEWDGWAHWVPKARAIYHFGRLDPELLGFLPHLSYASYPQGLPAVHSVAFHAMGAADEVTLHLQYWFYAVAFTGAVVGLLAGRVRQTILVPVLLLALLAPSFVGRMTSTYADVPLGFLVAVAALLVVLWIEDRQAWQLSAVTILLGGALLTKREGLPLAACVLTAGLVASWGDRRAVWPRLVAVGIAASALAVPWWLWLTTQGLPGDGPTTGFLAVFRNVDRAWPTVELVVTTFFDREFWLFAPTVATVAIVLAFVARAWVTAIYAATFALSGLVAATWIIWSDTSLLITQDDAENPIVRLTGTSILALVTLTPLLLERAWSAGEASGVRLRWFPGLKAFTWRSRGAWLVVLVALFAYPVSMLVGYSDRGFPEGAPRFPSTSDCEPPPAPGERVRLVIGYAGSYPEAFALRERVADSRLGHARVAMDGCGRLRVAVHGFHSVPAATSLLARVRGAGLEPTLERDSET